MKKVFKKDKTEEKRKKKLLLVQLKHLLIHQLNSVDSLKKKNKKIKVKHFIQRLK